MSLKSILTFHSFFIESADVLEGLLGGRDEPRLPLLQPPVVVHLLVKAVVAVAGISLPQTGN